MIAEEVTSATPTGRAAATARLLWLACRRVPDPAEVQAALAAGADVIGAARAAVAQGVAGLLWRALDAAGALDALGPERAPLRDLVEVQKLRALLLVPAALSRALSPLAAAGLEPVVLKGPAVARRYPAPELRPFDDLDVLLPAAVHHDAVEALVSAGWEVRRGARRDRYDSVLRHPEVPDLPLELHYGLDAWHDRAGAPDPDVLWRARVPVVLCGVPAHALAPADDLVALCAHAAKPFHGFSRLIWIADLAMLLSDVAERGEPLDWDRAAALARAGRCTTAVAAALGLARFADAADAGGRFPVPTGGWRGTALTRLVQPCWPLAPEAPIHLRFALADGMWHRMLLLAGYTHEGGVGGGLAWQLRGPGLALRRWRELRRAGATGRAARPGRR